MSLDQAIEYAQNHRDQYLEELFELLKIPSISTLPEHEKDITRAAQWLKDRLEKMGFDQAEVLPTGRHPVVYAESLNAGESAPTVLFYGHYDVQPTDPIDEWDSAPFEPVMRGEDVYARGASDMKGQLVAFLNAIEAILATDNLPVNLKFMLEGEEEIGSPNLEAFVSNHKQKLACDFCLNADSSILAPDRPSITIALRGLSYFEVRLRGQRSDLHSGMFGGVVDNPANVVCELVAGMRDEAGRVTIPGFYDDVHDLSEAERALLPNLDDDWWREHAGAALLFGDPAYSVTERARARPTFDVNGILSGFTGEGSKTVLPAKAMVKFSMRLVPDQKPEKIRAAVEKYLEQHIPETMSWELIEHASAPPSVISHDSREVQAAVNALKKVWDEQPLFDRVGGTVPIVGIIQEILKADSLMLGFGLPSDNIHGPNEKQHLPNYFRGIETFIRFVYAIGN
ncbi:MAG: dipeptidase [Anaerolineales bacterium]|jgi:acetylornithine deacetylase/succinyl-diaminopimelate desuccinylase-like protein